MNYRLLEKACYNSKYISALNKPQINQLIWRRSCLKNIFHSTIPFRQTKHRKPKYLEHTVRKEGLQNLTLTEHNESRISMEKLSNLPNEIQRIDDTARALT